MQLAARTQRPGHVHPILEWLIALFVVVTLSLCLRLWTNLSPGAAWTLLYLGSAVLGGMLFLVPMIRGQTLVRGCGIGIGLAGFEEAIRAATPMVGKVQATALSVFTAILVAAALYGAAELGRRSARSF